MEDLQIIELYWKRDQQAIEECREKYSVYCFSVADHILNSREDSEECVNDTWFHAWNTIPPHRPKILRMFLAKITRRAAFNRFKANSAQKRGNGQVMLVLEELAECLPDRAPVEERVEAMETLEIIDRFLEREGEEARKAFLLRYWHCFSLPEVAKRLGRTQSSTKSLLFRLRRRLKAELERGERRI